MPPPSSPSSSAAPPTSGQVALDAVWWGGRLRQVTVASRRPAAARLFGAKTPPQVRALVPRLFSLCGKAQAAVAEAALAAAAGEPAPSVDRQALQREAIGEHLWRLMLDWPERIGQFPPADGAARSSPSLGADLHLQKKAANATFAALYRRLRNPQPDDADAALCPALSAWLVDTPTEPMLAALGPWDARLARPILPLAPMPTADTLASTFASADAAFAEHPVWQGNACEVGAFASAQALPEVAALVDAGRPLAARWLARRRALEAAIAELGTGAGTSDGDAVVARQLRPGLAFAWTMTARGPLCHRVELAGGMVVDYQVIAPTEWNFHHASAWLDHLRGARAETPEIAENLLRLWALALDPCVPLALNLTKE